jgi:hypothetical protein
MHTQFFVPSNSWEKIKKGLGKGRDEKNIYIHTKNRIESV